MNTYTKTVYAYICIYASEMTYIVSSGALNSTHSLTCMHMLNCSTFVVNKRATVLTLYRFLPLLYVLICQWRKVFLQKSYLQKFSITVDIRTTGQYRSKSQHFRYLLLLKF